MTQVHAAIGVIVAEGRILVSRRMKADRFEHCWEFPGGKLMPQESAQECIHRELLEELGITVEVVGRLAPINHDYGDFKVCLHPFVVTLESGTAEALASRELKWVTVEEMAELEFPPANAELVRALPQILRSLGLLGA